MCLHLVDPVPTCKWGIGYKALKSDYKAPIQGFQFRMGEWHKDPKDYNLLSDSGIHYPAGFHIYLERNDAKAFTVPGEVVVKVRFRKVVATGGDEQVVAKEIKLLKVVARR